MPRIRIEEELWSKGHDLRRREWRVLIDDLSRDDSIWPAKRGQTLVLGVDDAAIRLRFVDETGAGEAFEVPRAALSRELSEYLAVMDRLADDGMNSARAEALDMAKRVVHDAAARKLGDLLPGTSSSLETRRRLFTLIVSLVADTTGKPRGHLKRAPRQE
jgi:uncharacterized protein (UPF0262 family)